ncbi:MAG: hypothetical protein IJ788_02805 [Oscillospiraceae bacterium]|nr:hypothetical protein [Oscillospiraceae bacterium]
MNGVTQLLIYPAVNAQLGSEKYGEMLFIMSIINTAATAIGSSCNGARFRDSAEGRTNNRPYNIIMLAGSVLICVVILFFNLLGITLLEAAELSLVLLLSVATTWRYYLDADHKLRLDFKSGFIFYLFISVGYLIGIPLLRATGQWAFALLIGEAACFIPILYSGILLRKDKEPVSGEFRTALRYVLALSGGNLLSQLIFNGDRFLLKLLINGEAVTTFYIASLFGKTMSFITVPLSGVIIGYLVKYKGELSLKVTNIVTAISVVFVALATAACTLASHIILPFLYPDDFAAASTYFVIGNMALILFFIGSLILSSVLLRYANMRYQFTINVIYAVLFCALCIPLTILQGVAGFAIGILITNGIRFIGVFALCYKVALSHKSSEER